MAELRFRLPTLVNTSGLDAALRAVLNSKCTGVSTYIEPGLVSVWLTDAATGDDAAAARVICGQHDPAFLTVDQATIPADGVTTATITVSAPRDGAAPIVLVCTLPSGNQQSQAVALSGGVGSVGFNTVIPGVYTFTLQNPQNRTGDVLKVTAT